MLQKCAYQPATLVPEVYCALLKPDGIMAGHNFLTAEEVQEEGIDWSVCDDGTRHKGAVRGTVEVLVLPKGLTIKVTY